MSCWHVTRLPRYLVRSTNEPFSIYGCLLEFSRIPAAKTLKNLYRLQTGEENQNTKNKNRKLRNWWLRTKLTTGRFATGRFSPCTWKISPVGKDIVVFVMIERIFTSSLSTNALYDFSCHQRASVHNKQKNTWLLVDMEFLFLFFFRFANELRLFYGYQMVLHSGWIQEYSLTKFALQSCFFFLKVLSRLPS